MRRALLVLLALAVVAPGWAALGPRYGGDLTVAVVGPLPRLDSATYDSAVGRLLLALTREPLVGIGSDGLPVPGLARSWSAAADGREWTLVLADDARFHDDAPVRADDAVRSLRAFLVGGSPAARRLGESLAPDGIAAPDPGHVVLRFREPLALPLAPLAGAPISGARGADAGPYIPTHEVPGRRIALTAFASHVRGRPYFDRIALNASDDEDRLRADLATRAVDVAINLPGISSRAGMLLLVLDPAQPVLATREARSALASAIDADAIVKRYLPGAIASRTLLAGSAGTASSTSPPVPGHSFAGAVALAVSSEVSPLVSQRIVAHLDALGLRASVRVLDPRAARRADAALRLLLFVPELPEPGLALRELAGLAPSLSAAEAALSAADRASDAAGRRSALERAAAALSEEQALVPLAAVPLSAGVRPGLEGVRVDAAGRLLLEDAWTTTQ